MPVDDDFAGIHPFRVVAPEGQTLPVVLNSPHSGRYYPPRFIAMSRLSQSVIRKSEDCFVDELVLPGTTFGIPMLAAEFPRAYLDVNREAWELDPHMFAEQLPAFANTRSARVAGGLGTIPKLVGEGLNIYNGKLPVAEAFERIHHLYKPYHAQLREMLLSTRARFGYAVLIDCHSMPATVKAGESNIRPDFVIGDRFGTSASALLSRQAITLLQASGYAVAHNKPYSGGFITEHYGRPSQGIHVLQLEINRGLYLDEKTYRKKARFPALANDIGRFLGELSALPSSYITGTPLAAE